MLYGQGEEVRSERASTNRELKRRFYQVQRAKDAGIIGEHRQAHDHRQDWHSFYWA